MRKLAQGLSTFSQDVSEHARTLQQRFAEMGQTVWNDGRYAEFESMLTPVMERLLGLCEVLESEHAPHLRSLAQLLEEYES